MRNTCFIVVVFFTIYSFGQNINPLQSKDINAQKQWVDSLYNVMSLNEKIGQLFMVRAFSKKDLKHQAKVAKLIKEHHIGGIIYSTGGPIRQAKLNNTYQAISKTPLLIGMDAEWGLSMRLDSTYAFPWNMTLGAIKNNDLIEQTGKHIGEHCKRIGVHFNFGPVVDINTNPNNPIIGNRSFGEDRNNVTAKSLAFIKGMQDAGVLANAKHFPGHGDTETDSHKTLPTINFNQKRIDSMELYPYKQLIKKGLSSVMVAHLNVPSLEVKSGFPSSLSKTIVTDILKERLGFQGLIFTDALEMKGVSNYSNPGDIDLAAFLAGNDVLLISEDVPKAILKIKDAYTKNEISEERLAHSVKKILMAKYKVGLHTYKPIAIANLVSDLNRIEDNVLHEKLVEDAITVVKNNNQILPLQNLDTKNIAYVSLGDDDSSTFLNTLKQYTHITHIKTDKLNVLVNKLKQFNTVIVGFHKSNANPWKSHKFSNKDLVWLYEIARTNNVILNVFTKPYALLDVTTHTNINGLIVSYQNSSISQSKTAQLIFGAIPAKGCLPVSCGEDFPEGLGVTYNSISRLGYALPEFVGMSSKKLKKLDSLANYAITNKMTPGIQLLVARKGKVIYNKTFGKHTYNGDRKVQKHDIYDVASLTKILATVPLIMELEEQGIINVDSKISTLLPSYKKSNKKDITVKTMLSHYAQLRPWIPYYINTIDSVTKKPLPKYYQKTFSKKFNIEVTKDLYMRSDYKDSINSILKESDLLSRLRYRYSDLPYYILKEYLESYYKKPLDQLAEDHFYRSLGANYTMYNPYKKVDLSLIVPTEEDNYFRYQKIHGYVHDMGAAMQNGVGGHAGLFSNANDVAKIMQMYLQKGYYGGKRYFKPETIATFTTCHFCDKNNRRGIGFDKPQLEDEGPTCGCVSMDSFGHSGFTGAYTWADPEEDIVYVFLANRTYPTSKGKNMLLRANIRTDIQKYIYEAILNEN